MKITVRHNQTEIVADLPQRTDEHYRHPIGAYYDDSTTLDKSPPLQRLLKLIKAMADKVINMDNGISQSKKACQ